MVLREILKTDTSSSEHTKLNKYHENDNKSTQAKREDVVEFKQPTSLLSDPQKFAEFQNAIFASPSTEKRKKQDKDDDESDTKKLKTEAKDESLKI